MHGYGLIKITKQNLNIIPIQVLSTDLFYLFVYIHFKTIKLVLYLNI